ncbi:MAG: hypothetical protein RL328_1260 [Acidobacteriota bacterium]
MTVKGNQRRLYRFIRLLFASKRPRAVVRAECQERAHGRDSHWVLRALQAPEWVTQRWPGLRWLVEVRQVGRRGNKPVDECHYFLSSVQTSGSALLQLIRNRWSIENGWHWVRDVVFGEDRHRYWELNGTQVLAAMRTLAMNLLRLSGFHSLTAGLDAVAHDLHAMLNL